MTISKNINISKTITYFISLSLVILLAACGKSDKSSNDEDNEGYDVVAHLEFSSGEVMDFKANSVVNMAEPFINEKNNGERIVTAAYQKVVDDLIYRLSIKTVVKEEPGNYTMYLDASNQLEDLGFYIEFTVQSKAGSGGTVNDLYRTQYISGESGNLNITSVTNDRLKATFNADIKYMPLSKAKHLKITDGKLDIALQWIDQ